MLYFNLALLLSTAGAFMVAPPLPAHSLRAATPLMQEEPEPEVEAVVEEGAADATPPEGWMSVQEDAFNIWSPEKTPDMRIEGGDTLRTFKMGPQDERVQYILTSPNGRPLKAKVELWIGPIRCVHELFYDCMGGESYPLKATLQFKKGVAPVLKVATYGEYEFPVQCGVFVPSPEESKALGDYKKDFFYSAPMKDAVQGGSTIDKKGGAIRSFDIPATWDKTQIMVWSKDVGKKSFKTNIEVLQGPNNQKQHLNLRCGGSTQPYHAVIDTPGNGWMIRCNSKKFVEDGKFEIAVGPYGMEVPAPEADSGVMLTQPY